MGFVLRSYLPGSFIAEVANTAQQNAMCALRLQVQLYLHVKGDKCTEGAPRLARPLSMYALRVTHHKRINQTRSQRSC